MVDSTIIRRVIRKILTESEEYSDPIIDSIVDRVIDHEGLEPKVYKDSKGIPTIGVGFNLNRTDSNDLLKSVGANPSKIKSGKEALNDKQIRKLLKYTLKEAKDDVNSLVKNFTSLPKSVQGVLIEMTFNLGLRGLSQFKKFLQYVEKKQWDKASKEMLNSYWSKQVGQRAVKLSNIIKSASKITIDQDTYDSYQNTDTYMGKEFDKRTGLNPNYKIGNLINKK